MYQCRGSNLPAELQEEAKSIFTRRYTGEHIPDWLTDNPRADGRPWPLQFADDADWLANCTFWVTSSPAKGVKRRHRIFDRRLVRRIGCKAYPTWPMNPELAELEAFLKSQLFGQEHFHIEPDGSDIFD